MATIFSKIIKGEIPSHKIAENDQFLAFLDINPLVEGHVLVIPKVEVDYLFDLDDDTYLQLLSFAKPIAAALKKAISCKRVGMAVVGLEVPHVHIHLVPMSQMDDINFTKAKMQVSEKNLEATASKIRAVMAIN